MIGCAVLFAFGYLVQRHLINEVVTAPIFISFTLTFGLDLLLNNAMIQAFTATPRSLVLDYGSITIFRRQPFDRAARRHGPGIGPDRTALLAAASFADGPRHHRGADGPLCGAACSAFACERIYAITFGIGALMAAAAGAAMAVVFPITPLLSGVFLGKAFVICVLGGLGSVPGALVGGLALGLLESFGAVVFGSQWSTTVGFALMILVLVVRPSGLVGRKGFE